MHATSAWSAAPVTAVTRPPLCACTLIGAGPSLPLNPAMVDAAYPSTCAIRKACTRMIARRSYSRGKGKEHPLIQRDENHGNSSASALRPDAWRQQLDGFDERGVRRGWGRWLR